MDHSSSSTSSSSSSSSSSFPILAISILGILATAILLLGYYLFIINCCLSCRRRLRHRRAAAPVRTAAPARGLDGSAIRSIPTLRYSAEPINPPLETECAVCLAEFEQQQLLRVLPGCRHSFHIDCIDAWLQSSPNCPLCRFDVTRPPIPPCPSQAPAAEAAPPVAEAGTPTRTKKNKKNPPREFRQAASMGDECIDVGRRDDDDDGSFAVAQPIRRSFSMDSSNDRALFLSVQDALHAQRSGRDFRRSLFSFGRSSRSSTAVLPVQSELL